MKPELLHEYGQNGEGKLINAKNASKGEKYNCPGCKAEFILKKSGKTGPGTRRPHFAHINSVSSCSYESYLHKTFIILATELLAHQIHNNQPLPFQWACNTCNQKHFFNLIGFSEAKSEYNMVDRRPDIALLDKTGNVSIVIEVVYKHPPEDGALQFYREHNIRVIQIIISSEEDLNNVEQKLRNPASFDLCTIPLVHTIPRIGITIPRRNNYNGVPSDFLDNPNKYNQAKNGDIYHRRSYSSHRKNYYKKNKWK